MANRYLTQFFWSFIRYPVRLYGQATIGSSGAVTLSASNSKGIASITKESTAGQYTIVLQDQYVAFLGFQVSVLLASGTPAVLGYAVMSQTVNASTKTVVIQFLDAAGAAANPDSGAVLYFSIDLNNSTAI